MGGRIDKAGRIHFIGRHLARKKVRTSGDQTMRTIPVLVWPMVSEVPLEIPKKKKDVFILEMLDYV